jgi:hypothetical protein
MGIALNVVRQPASAERILGHRNFAADDGFELTASGPPGTRSTRPWARQPGGDRATGTWKRVPVVC